MAATPARSTEGKPLPAVPPAHCPGLRPRWRWTGNGGPGASYRTRPDTKCPHQSSCALRSAHRLMGLVDRWVVQTTLAALGRGAIPVPPKPAARGRSTSPGQTLSDVQFLEFVVECLDAALELTLRRWCFEITESAVVANLDHARRFVGVLARHGLSVCVGRLRLGCGLVLQPQEPAYGLPEDRRLVHAQPGAGYSQSGHGHPQ